MQEQKKKAPWKKYLIRTLLVLAVLAAAAGACITLRPWIRRPKGELTGYRYSSGGGMNGGHYQETVRELNAEQAIVTIESMDWWGAVPDAAEYLVDRSILTDLQAVYDKYHMHRWHNKTFTRMFVYDGESYSYQFDFAEDSTWFSSQIYPRRYWKKLDQLDEVIQRYLTDAERLPGVVKDESTEEDFLYDAEVPMDGELHLQVVGWFNNNVYYRILNGMEETAEVEEAYRLVKVESDGSETLLVEETNPYDWTCDIVSQDVLSDSFCCTTRPEAGQYRLYFGELETDFEMR